MKKILSLMLCVFVFSLFCAGFAFSSNAEIFAAGDGSQESPYVIETTEQLSAFSASVSAGTTYSGLYVALGADIFVNPSAGFESWAQTAPETVFTPVGALNRPFKGTFDGAGYVISGLYVSSSYPDRGLFGIVSDSVIKNVTLVRSYIGGGMRTGGIVGYATSSTVSSCSCRDVIVSGSDFTGGIAGRISGTVTDCMTFGTVSGGDFTGGIVGYLSSGIVSTSYGASVVASNNWHAGVVGANGGTVSDCYYVKNETVNADIIGAYPSVESGGTVVVGEEQGSTGAEYSDTAGQTAALTYTDMESAASFVGFDFTSAWTVNASGTFVYPVPSSGYAVYSVGDVTRDGRIGVADARMALDASVGLVTLNDEQRPLADYDGSGVLTSTDARKILSFALAE